MRETLQQAAKKLLKDPAGTEKVIAINVNDGLTGFPPGMSDRGARVKQNTVKVLAETRADGKKRSVVRLVGKDTVLAAGDWE
ncbi:MAG TPA: hypothetical protein VGO62_21985 [Myxococcota bacterium]|jgi:hypothetical protein